VWAKIRALNPTSTDQNFRPKQNRVCAHNRNNSSEENGMRISNLCAALFVILVAVPCVFAGNYVMGYSPAGGVTVAQAGGPPYTSSPALFAYSNFNSSAYQSLYYGVNFVANVAQSNVMSPGTMAFQGYNPATGVLAWTSTQNWNFTNTITLAPVSTQTQLIVQIQSYTGTPGFLGSGFLNGETTSKSALGISGGNANDPLFQVVSAGPFQATFQFLTWDGSASTIGTGQDLLDYYNANNGGNATTVFNTSVDFEFWWNIRKTSAKTVQVGTCLTTLPNYATIQTAISAVPSGATVEVCPGTYNEQLSISAPLTLKGIASGTNQSVVLTVPPVFEQSGTTPVTGFPVYAQVLVQDAGPVNISGLTVDGNNSGCPSGGAVAGVVYLSATSPSSGKLTNSVIRNTANGCGSQGAGIYTENGSGFASSITVQNNSIHSINGSGVIFGPNIGGTISSNTITQTSGALGFQQSGPTAKVSGNTISASQTGVSLNSATGVVVQGNTFVNMSGNAVSLQDSSSGGNNNVTKNTINEASCGISTSGAASSDVFLPNTVLNSNQSTCN
jgi:hypothetical protein